MFTSRQKVGAAIIGVALSSASCGPTQPEDRLSRDQILSLEQIGVSPKEFCSWADRHDLDPKTTNCFELACLDMKLNPNSTSYIQLGFAHLLNGPNKLSSDQALDILSQHLGEHWIQTILEPKGAAPK